VAFRELGKTFLRGPRNATEGVPYRALRNANAILQPILCRARSLANGSEPRPIQTMHNGASAFASSAKQTSFRYVREGRHSGARSENQSLARKMCPRLTRPSRTSMRKVALGGLESFHAGNV